MSQIAVEPHERRECLREGKRERGTSGGEGGGEGGQNGLRTGAGRRRRKAAWSWVFLVWLKKGSGTETNEEKREGDRDGAVGWEMCQGLEKAVHECYRCV